MVLPLWITHQFIPADTYPPSPSLLDRLLVTLLLQRNGCPSNSSRKRPLEVMAGVTIGDAIDTRSTYNDDVMVNQKNLSFTSSCNVSADRDGEDKNDVYCVHRSEGSDCSDTEEDEDMVSEIIDLQKALEYLVSERDIDHTYNNGDKQKQHTTQSHTTTTTTESNDTRQQNDQLYLIPNLVNRIIMEHYSSANKKHKHADAKNYMSRKQRDKMTKLLIAVIVEFAEPYFVRKAQYRKQERDKLLFQQQKKKHQTEEKHMTKKKHSQSAAPQDECTSSSFSFDERAISWATSCIKQLLQTPSSSSTVNITNKNCEDTIDDPVYDGHMIPELDALLSASGEHDGMEMEECMQSALLQGLQGRRLLQCMGLSFVGDLK